MPGGQSSPHQGDEVSPVVSTFFIDGAFPGEEPEVVLHGIDGESSDSQDDEEDNDDDGDGDVFLDHLGGVELCIYSNTIMQIKLINEGDNNGGDENRQSSNVDPIQE